MIRRLIILLLIVGCEEPLEPEDCAGVAGGDAVLDDCGVCDGIDGYLAGSCYDCAGVAFGMAQPDNCGVCDSDLSNDCVPDCAGVWGGTALEDNCGTCDSDSSNDCIIECTTGEIFNCFPEYSGASLDCCPINMVDNNFCDGADQLYNCDLRCYDCVEWNNGGTDGPQTDQDDCVAVAYSAVEDDWGGNDGIAGDSTYNDGGDCDCIPFSDCETCTWCGTMDSECEGVADVDCSSCENCPGGGYGYHCIGSICTCSDASADTCCPNTVPNCKPDFEVPWGDGSAVTSQCCSLDLLGSGWCNNELQPFGCDLTCYSKEPDGNYCQISGQGDIVSGLPICSDSHLGIDGGDCEDCAITQDVCEDNYMCGYWLNDDCGIHNCGDCSSAKYDSSYTCSGTIAPDGGYNNGHCVKD